LGSPKDFATLKAFFHDSQTRRVNIFATTLRSIEDQANLLVSTGLLAAIDLKAKKAAERTEKKSSA
jgi:hypothetical protein